jgi:hypothetical protein
MALERTRTPTTGIYSEETVRLVPGDPEADIEVADLNRGWGLEAILQDATAFAARVLHGCGVELLDSCPTTGRITIAGEFFIRVPDSRPAGVKLPEEPVRASSELLDVWWKSRIGTARDVLSAVRNVRDRLDGSAAEAAVYGYRLGRATEMLRVMHLEPRAMTGLKRRAASTKGISSLQEQRRDRNAFFREEARRMQAKGLSDKNIAERLAASGDNRPEIKPDAIRKVIRVRTVT